MIPVLAAVGKSTNGAMEDEPMFVAGLIMMKKSPELLRKRLDAREEESEQKAVIVLSGLMFLAAFAVAGLNYRFGWIILPDWVSYAAAIIFLLAYGLYAEVKLFLLPAELFFVRRGVSPLYDFRHACLLIRNAAG